MLSSLTQRYTAPVIATPGSCVVPGPIQRVLIHGDNLVERGRLELAHQQRALSREPLEGRPAAGWEGPLSCLL